jgi:hypothetical protein
MVRLTLVQQGPTTIVDLPIVALTKTFSLLDDVARDQFLKSKVLPEVVRFIPQLSWRVGLMSFLGALVSG